MREKYNPTRILQDIQKEKYKKAVLPIALIFLSLYLQNYYLEAKYLAGIGLLLYFYTSFILYRISKNMPPEVDREVMFSPIYGTVQAIEDNKVIIKKSQFDPADFRLGITRKKFDYEFNGKLTILDKDIDIPGRLIGFMPGKGSLTCTLPKGFEFEVVPGTRVLAGETILAIAPEAETVKEDEEQQI